MEQKKDRRAVGVKVLPEGVEEYCERHTTALTELHERLLKETEEKTTTANFLVGEIEGAFLKMLVRMTQAKRILEVGMFTGYSALSFAEALPPDGSIVTCELDPTAIDIARRFFAQSPHARKIEIREGRAAETLKNIARPLRSLFHRRRQTELRLLLRSMCGINAQGRDDCARQYAALRPGTQSNRRRCAHCQRIE